MLQNKSKWVSDSENLIYILKDKWLTPRSHSFYVGFTCNIIGENKISSLFNRRASLSICLANKSCYAMVYYELYLLNNIGSLFIRFSELLYQKHKNKTTIFRRSKIQNIQKHKLQWFIVLYKRTRIKPNVDDSCKITDV